MPLAKGHLYLLPPLFLLVLYSTITSFVSSINIANSLPQTIRLSFVTIILLFCMKFRSVIVIKALELGSSILIIILWIISLLFFTRFAFTPLFVNLNDLSQFRYLYIPCGILSNDWVSLQLLLLPFPLVALSRNISTQPSWQGQLNVVAVSLALCGIIMTMSRIGWFCDVIIIIFLFVLTTKRIILKKHFAIVCLLVLLTISILALISPEGIYSTICQTESHQESATGRFRQLDIIHKLSTMQICYGVGLSNFALFSYAKSIFSLDYTFTGRANMSILNIIVESGICGLIIYLMLLFSIIYILYKMYKTNQVINKYTTFTLGTIMFVIILKECSFTSITHNVYYLLLFLLPYVVYPQSDYKDNKGSSHIRFYLIANLICLFLCAYCQIFDNKNDAKYAQAGFLSSTSVRVDFNSMKACSDYSNLDEAIAHYNKALENNDYDASYYHNIAWLYYCKGELSQTMRNISEAVERNANNPLYYVAKGLFTEKEGYLHLALNLYTKALLLNPSICFSRFWRDFSDRHPIESREIVLSVIKKLEIYPNMNSKIMSKLGILYYYIGNVAQAKMLLGETIRKMPNLNRVWLYMYFIESDNSIRKEYIKRAVFLNPSDNVPSYIKYHNDRFLHEVTDYETKRSRLYPYYISMHDYLPKNLYEYVMTPTLLY